MADEIDAAEVTRLLTPGNLGLRAVLAVAKHVPDCDFPADLTEQGFVGVMMDMDEDDRQEAVAVLKGVEQEIAKIIVERGGSAPELRS